MEMKLRNFWQGSRKGFNLVSDVAGIGTAGKLGFNCIQDKFTDT